MEVKARDAHYFPRTKSTRISPSDSTSATQQPRYRRSIRKRPSMLVDRHDAQYSSMTQESFPAPSLQSRSSKMSLFNLFSKPKVERARGYHEAGLAVPPAVPPKHANPSRANLVLHVGTDNGKQERNPRPPSSFSMRTSTMTSKSRVKPPGPLPVKQSGPGERMAFWEPPPLFQAFPQSMKEGLLEVSTASTETVLQKSKSRKNGSLHVSTAEPTPRGSVEDNLSVETRRTARTTVRHVANGSITQFELPKKIIVMVTSGYLLQYAETGPSDRLPERVLQLGKDSAAFACDLIPGKHYVLQISQAVDQQGVVLANSGSIFSKLGLRSVASRRMTSNFLLVLPNAEEMESWMTAIRDEIEALGGSKARPDTAIRPKTRETAAQMTGLKQSGLRYQVRKQASKLSLLSSPSVEALGQRLPTRRNQDEGDDSDTATLDGIEQEAAQLTEDGRAPSRTGNGESDAQSVRSSVAVSVDQQRLNSLRSSNRASHSTSATTVGTSRTNSLTGSPPSEHPPHGIPELNGDNLPKSPYRNLSSYAAGRRRSAMPMPSTREQPLQTVDLSTQIMRNAAMAASVDSPVTGRNPPFIVHASSPRLLAGANSVPNLRAAAEVKAKHDSKMPTPPLPTEDSPRPLSIVGDLPPSSAWNTERSPNRRTSALQATGSRTTARGAGPRTAEPMRARRQSAQVLSLPLKINPTTAANRPPSRNENRGSFNNIDESSGEPQVYTLTAKIEPQSRFSVTPPAPTDSPKPEVPLKSPARSTSGRLSLFPPTTPSPPASAHESLKPSPTIPAPSDPAQAQAAARALKRPASLQVRTDHAPFLQNVRASSTAPPIRAVTAPIRSLKPSRSASNVRPQASPTDPFTITSVMLEPPTLQEEEESDKPTPLMMRPPSRASARKVRTRSSLPELDLGIPVVGLGPPAPPPSAPLPPPPSASRPTSPMPGATGLGIRV